MAAPAAPAIPSPDLTWLGSHSGGSIELVEPLAHEVDFADLAASLASINRYVGHAATPCSVGLHLLIGYDLAPDALKPWWLLHDAHESRLGDIASPTKKALFALAHQVGGARAAAAVRAVHAEFVARHDRVIHAAAGLPLPTPEQREGIAALDLVCLATEQHLFHREPRRPWPHVALGIRPARTAWRYQPADRIADHLLKRFERHLPSLRGRGRC